VLVMDGGYSGRGLMHLDADFCLAADDVSGNPPTRVVPQLWRCSGDVVVQAQFPAASLSPTDLPPKHGKALGLARLCLFWLRRSPDRACALDAFGALRS